MGRLVCWLIGHRWVYLRVAVPCANNLSNISPLAACDADCARCGKQWRDFELHAMVCGAVEQTR